MDDLKGRGGELRATIQVKRAATGKVDTFDLVARTTPEQHEQIMGAVKQNRTHGSAGSMVGQGAAVNNQPKEN